VTLYRLNESQSPLIAPVVVAAFDGWIDAGGAATACANHIAEGGEVLAAFDADLLNDFRSRRPVLDVIDGQLQRLTWPELQLTRARHDGRDLLVLVGPEPDFRWRQLGEEIMELVVRLGVVQWLSLGAIPAALPHTRTTPVFATASTDGLLRDDEERGPQGLLRVPAAALSAIELAVSGAGIPSVGYYAQVPHYVGGSYTAAAIALLERVERHLNVTIPLGSLPSDAIAQRQRLDAAVAADEDSRLYLERLEKLAGEEQGVPSGDEIASEIERFLRDQTGGDEPGRLGR
jgi:hypothetical protein